MFYAISGQNFTFFANRFLSTRSRRGLQKVTSRALALRQSILGELK